MRDKAASGTQVLCQRSYDGHAMPLPWLGLVYILITVDNTLHPTLRLSDSRSPRVQSASHAANSRRLSLGARAQRSDGHGPVSCKVNAIALSRPHLRSAHHCPEWYTSGGSLRRWSGILLLRGSSGQLTEIRFVPPPFLRTMR